MEVQIQTEYNGLQS